MFKMRIIEIIRAFNLSDLDLLGFLSKFLLQSFFIEASWDLFSWELGRHMVTHVCSYYNFNNNSRSILIIPNMMNSAAYQTPQMNNNDPNMNNPYQEGQYQQQQQHQRKGNAQHLQKRIYPGMVDQSFDSVQASNLDQYLVQDPTRQQTPVGYSNPYPESNQTPNQQSIDSRHLNAQHRQSSETELFNSQPGSAQQKIDGDAMPRPLKLINAYNYRAGVAERFPTKNTECPPSSGIPFIQVDEGQVGPKFMRGTVIQAPMEQDFQKQSNVPFGFLVQPLAEMTQQETINGIPDIPVIDYDHEGPFRCYRCKAYVNPNMIFTEGGTKAICNLCSFTNEVPVNYQSAMNEYGQRRDRLQRPELQFGAYEFKAPPSYLTSKPLNPTYVFVIDTSQFALHSGFFSQIVQSIKMTLDYIQHNPEETSLCFITYDINIHFYNLSQDPNGEPNVMWVGELQDPFVPYPKEKLMLNLVRDRERIDIFLDKLLNMHHLEQKKYQAPYVCTGAAFNAAKQLLAKEGGRIIVFASNVSNSGWGTLICRDDPKLYNSDKEKSILSPASDIYVKIAEECITERVVVDLFYAINNPKSIDLTSIAPLATLTGGDLYFFNGYDAAKHAEKLHYDLFRVLYRNQVSEVAIKARTSTGLTVTEYFGSFGFKETADFELSAFDSDKSIGFLVRCDEKLKDDPTYQAFVQFAIMYCTFQGEKRIRVFNYSLTVAKTLNAYYKAADQETLAQFMIKHELSRVFQRGAKATRELMTNNLVNLLHVYRQKCAAKTSISQMVLPENLKLLPLYTLTAFKNPALRMFPGVKLDDKVHWVYKTLKMPISQMPYFLYPRIYKVTDVYSETSSFYQYGEINSRLMQKPQSLPATMEKLLPTDAYVLDNSEYLYLYLGNQVDPLFIQAVFGYANFSDLKFNGITSFYPTEELPTSLVLSEFLEQLRTEKIGIGYQPVRLVYAGDSSQEKEMVETCLVEDSVDINKEFPYTEFLCMLHKLIRNKSQ